MSPSTINAIRDLAVSYENKNLQVACELMELAHQARPAGPYIKRKYDSYKRKLPATLKLSKLVGNKEIVIIPIGFRCYTNSFIEKTLGLSLPSFPFTNGFFSPTSVASVFKNPKINLQYSNNKKSHSICIKNEPCQDGEFGRGIQFIRSTYDEINTLAKTRDQKNIRTLLDSTFGYYTLDNYHKFILAHYNWHPFAHESKSKGITNPSANLDTINTILNRRISRMLELCDQAKHLFFIFHENEKYNYLKIDDEFFHLNQFKELDAICESKYGSKYNRVMSDNITGPESILDLCGM